MKIKKQDDKKILLCSINSRYIHSSLAVYYLNSAISCEGKIVEWTINADKEKLIKLIEESNIEILGFSCYIWNIDYVRQVALEIRKNNKKIKIVMGGPEVSYNYDYLLKEDIADYIVIGEGEVPFKLLVERLQAGEEPGNIKGVSSKKHRNGAFYSDEIPPNPYTDDYKRRLKGRISYIETVRGCPFGCSFCLSGRKEPVKYLPMEHVKERIDYLVHSGTQTIKFVDRSFNANEKRAIEIVQYVLSGYKSYPKGLQLHFEVAADIMSERLIDLLCSAPKGLFRLEIGLQTLNSKTLEAVNRKTDIDRLKQNIYKLTRSGTLHIHLDLIAGLPYEDIESFKNSFNGVMALNPNVLQLGILKLLPGSPMADNPKGTFSDCPPYEVIETPWLTVDNIRELMDIDYAVDKVYNSGRFVQTLSVATQFKDDAYGFFKDYCTNMAVKRGESYNELSLKMLNFLVDSNNKEKIYAALRKDMKRTNPVGRLPQFLKI